MTEGGLRYNEGKPALHKEPRERFDRSGRALELWDWFYGRRLDLPQLCFESPEPVFAFGAKKYTSGNYLKGMKFSIVVDSALRHLVAYEQGLDGDRYNPRSHKDIDQESGLTHYAHLACNWTMLIVYLSADLGIDDRPIPEVI